MGERGLLAAVEGERDLRMIGIRGMHPLALVVLRAHMCDVVTDQRQDLIEEMTSPVEDCPT